jgi:hypothetical protein
VIKFIICILNIRKIYIGKMANANDNTTPITSITPPDLELWKAYLAYRDVKQQLRKYKKQPRYKIKIELSVISSKEIVGLKYPPIKTLPCLVKIN